MFTLAMPRKKKTPPFNHADAARKLRKYGFTFALLSKRKGANKAANKAAVTRALKKVSLYLPGGNKKQEFKFIPANTKAKVEAMQSVEPKVKTPNGFFVKIPKGVKSYKIKFSKDRKTGETRVVITVIGKRGGKRTEKAYKLNPALLALNPEQEIERVTRMKFKEGQHIDIKFTVNGFDSHTSKPKNSLSDFEKYAPDFFLAAIDPNHKPSYAASRFHGKQGSLTPEQFTDIFHIKIIRQEPG